MLEKNFPTGIFHRRIPTHRHSVASNSIDCRSTPDQHGFIGQKVMGEIDIPELL